MHFHHFSLLHLARYLTERHAGEVLLDCFSQNKQELVVEMESGSIRIGCQTPLTYVVPVANFSIARKNVVHLFEGLIGQRFVKARVVDWERILVLNWENGQDMILKMHGAAANVLLREGEAITDIFRKDKTADQDFVEIEGSYEPEKLVGLDFDENTPLPEISAAIRQVSPVFDKQFASRIKPLVAQGMDIAEALRKTEASARSDEFYLQKTAAGIKFLLFPPEKKEDTISLTGIAPAIEAFLASWFQYESYQRQHRRIAREIGKPVKKFQKVYTSYKRNVDSLETDRNPEEIGHLIMANLHAIPVGASKVELDDFYTGEKISIRLKPNLNPQDNAKRYYDKHKSRKGKLAYLKSQLSDIEGKLNRAEAQTQVFQEIPKPEELEFGGNGFDPKFLRELKKQMTAFEKPEKAAKEKRVPFRTFSMSGYDIFVGLNGKNNDVLTFKFANKEDIWLHAKDVAGSHVVVRSKAGQNLPQSVLQYAAGLAAFYSKLKNNALVPVTYTPRKFVRKRKGDPPGLVVVEREEVVMAEPVKG